MLGAVRPQWIKVTESEQRIAWLRLMIERNLVVRDVEAFAKSISVKLRSVRCKFREEEREILMGIMKLKLKVVKKNMIELKRKKELKMEWLIDQIGRGNRLDSILSRLRKDMIKLKNKLKKKFTAKLEHLAAERTKEIEEKKKLVTIPDELIEFKECSIYNEIKRQRLSKENVEGVIVGNVSLDEDELSIIKLSPKFAVLSKLEDESIERDIEISIAKMKYEIKRQKELELFEEVDMDIMDNKKVRFDDTVEEETENEVNEVRERQVFDPIGKIFDFSKRRATDCVENTKIHLPQMGDPKEESQLEMLQTLLWDEYLAFKKELEKKVKGGKKDATERNQEGDNLTKQQQAGLKKLKKRIKDGELLVIKTDKSGKLGVISREKYQEMGLRDSLNDVKIERNEIRKIEKKINDHTRMLLKVVNAGKAHGHLERISNSKITNSETEAPKYYLFKDHKEKENWRPVVSGCNSNTLGLSNLLSDMVESICCSIHNPYEVISSEDLLARIEEFNIKVKEGIKENGETWDWRHKWMMIGSDVISLFPMLTAVNTAKAVRTQSMKSSIKWENIDSRWLRLYIHLNRSLSSDISDVEHLLPSKRKGKRGKEPGMSSEECMGCYLEDIYDNGKPSSWTWPREPTSDELKVLMSIMLEISVRFFF